MNKLYVKLIQLLFKHTYKWDEYLGSGTVTFEMFDDIVKQYCLQEYGFFDDTNYRN